MVRFFLRRRVVVMETSELKENMNIEYVVMENLTNDDKNVFNTLTTAYNNCTRSCHHIADNEIFNHQN